MPLLPRFLTDPEIGRHLLRDEGEVIVDEVRKHWVVYVVPALIALAGFALLVLFPLTDVDLASVPLVLGLGLLAVLAAIIYRISQIDSTGPATVATAPQATLGLSAGARLLDTALEGDRAALTYADGDATVIVVLDLRTGAVIRRLTVGGGEVPREP